MTNNSFILVKLKIIKDKYFDIDKEKIAYDVNKKNLYDTFNSFSYSKAKTVYGTLELSKNEKLVVNYYKQNLEILKKQIQKNNLLPIFITQSRYDGISQKILYLINQETRIFCKNNNYKIINMDQLYSPEKGDYYDEVHTTPQGSLKIAKLVYQELSSVFSDLAKTDF